MQPGCPTCFGQRFRTRIATHIKFDFTFYLYLVLPQTLDGLSNVSAQKLPIRLNMTSPSTFTWFYLDPSLVRIALPHKTCQTDWVWLHLLLLIGLNSHPLFSRIVDQLCLNCPFVPFYSSPTNKASPIAFFSMSFCILHIIQRLLLGNQPRSCLVCESSRVGRDKNVRATGPTGNPPWPKSRVQVVALGREVLPLLNRTLQRLNLNLLTHIIDHYNHSPRGSPLDNPTVT